MKDKLNVLERSRMVYDMYDETNEYRDTPTHRVDSVHTESAYWYI